MILDDLDISISEMNREDLFSLIRGLRESRRTPKKKKSAPKRRVQVSKLDKAIKGLTSEQRQSLIETLEKKDGRRKNHR